MIAPLRSLLLPAALLLTMTSCEINLGYRIMSDGYRFDYEGASAVRDDAGALPEGVERLEVDHRFGEVQVAGADDVAPGWSWSVEVWADSDLEAAQIADELEVVQRPIQGGVRLELEIPEDRKRDLRGVRSTLLVTVPSHSLLELDNSHGDVRVSGLDGDTRLETRHGDVRLEHLRGNYTGEHAHGELFATSIADGAFSLEHGAVIVRGSGELRARARHADTSFDGVDGDLELDSAHGDVEIHGATQVDGTGAHGRWRVIDVSGVRIRNRHGSVKARLVAGTADVDVEHGNVVVERSPIQSLSHGHTLVRCAHGDVEIDLAPGTHADVDVRHGDATVRHATDEGSALYARARHGDIRSDLPVAQDENGPGVNAVVRTSHGDVRCVRVAGNGDL